MIQLLSSPYCHGRTTWLGRWSFRAQMRIWIAVTLAVLGFLFTIMTTDSIADNDRHFLLACPHTMLGGEHFYSLRDDQIQSSQTRPHVSLAGSEFGVR